MIPELYDFFHNIQTPTVYVEKIPETEDAMVCKLSVKDYELIQVKENYMPGIQNIYLRK